MRTNRKFASSPDILVAEGKISVANAIVPVVISGPENCNFNMQISSYSQKMSRMPMVV